MRYLLLTPSNSTLLAFLLAFPYAFADIFYHYPPRSARYLHLRKVQHLISDTIVMLRWLHAIFLLSLTMSGSSSPATLTLYIPRSAGLFPVLSVSAQNYLCRPGRYLLKPVDI